MMFEIGCFPGLRLLLLMNVETEADAEFESAELEAELLKTANEPSEPMPDGELREIADRALKEYRAKKPK